MILVPRCKGCSTPLVITKDALGRERYRCPACEGVAPPPPEPDVRHSQTATSSDDMPWPRPTLSAPSFGAFHAAMSAQISEAMTSTRRATCRDCGEPIAQPSRGRPRLRCHDAVACHRRQRPRRVVARVQESKPAATRSRGVRNGPKRRGRNSATDALFDALAIGRDCAIGAQVLASRFRMPIATVNTVMRRLSLRGLVGRDQFDRPMTANGRRTEWRYWRFA